MHGVPQMICWELCGRAESVQFFISLFLGMGLCLGILGLSMFQKKSGMCVKDIVFLLSLLHAPSPDNPGFSLSLSSFPFSSPAHI